MSGAFSGAPNAAPDLTNWDFSNVIKMDFFLYGTGINISAYSELLVKLESQNSTFRLSLHAGSSLYNVIGSNARKRLRIDHQWIIIDGGKIDGSCGDGIIDTDTDEECDDGQATHYCTETCTLADNFISTWLIEEGDLSLTLPLRPGYNYDFHVDWGDGSPPAHVNSHFDSDRMHTYASPNTYTVTIQGRLEAWYLITVAIRTSCSPYRIWEIPTGEALRTHFTAAKI